MQISTELGALTDTVQGLVQRIDSNKHCINSWSVLDILPQLLSTCNSIFLVSLGGHLGGPTQQETANRNPITMVYQRWNGWREEKNRRSPTNKEARELRSLFVVREDNRPCCSEPSNSCHSGYALTLRRSPSWGKKTLNLDIGCQNKMGKESPKLRLSFPKDFHHLGLRSSVFFPLLGRLSAERPPYPLKPTEAG